ncbi:hypothetical protein EPD60_07570 [Flaviaesturariibacter flavus]|uniref:DUF7660 domain-containing protein n=1 Tax=Flaviaesturariibacter flavus TaxID=2502780 RepID=A0A4R1BGD3_9BACT|nr:hypothetical protein [Flaviaesturariibacter flavus]TCJ15062.1 hypothetical protein EPD60_07935 [Flaviaesturariibacter flavus]TCJ16249.1 hypothetical protein EPD60_07570 [Flaviaesturariibacter flavus]
MDNIEQISTKDDLANFVKQLSEDLEANESEWENNTLLKYLNAVEAFLRDSNDDSFSSDHTWSTLAKIFIAASTYE